MRGYHLKCVQTMGEPNYRSDCICSLVCKCGHGQWGSGLEKWPCKTIHVNGLSQSTQLGPTNSIEIHMGQIFPRGSFSTLIKYRPCPYDIECMHSKLNCIWTQLQHTLVSSDPFYFQPMLDPFSFQPIVLNRLARGDPPLVDSAGAFCKAVSPTAQ